VKKESDTGAYEVLPQIPSLAGIDLGARVIEIVVFDKSTPLGIEKVICAGDNLPRQVRMTCPTASVDWDTTGYWIPNLDPSRFGVVNADPGACIRLKSLVSRCESQDEVRHERARIDPSGHVALCDSVTKAIIQGEVSATAKAIVKEIAFNRWTNYARAKHVTEFNAAVKTDVILRRDVQSGIKIPIGLVQKSVVSRKRSVSAAVLKDIRPRVDGSVETESIHWRRRRRGDLLVNFRSGLQRSGDESNQSCG
jgi:hypothetical protein